MSEIIRECPVCGSEAESYCFDKNSCVYWECPICGKYEYTRLNYGILDDPHLASFLFYNRFRIDSDLDNYRYHTTLSKDACDEYRKAFEEGNKDRGRPVHMDKEIIANWYPKTFAERIDYILLQINAFTKHIGQSIELNENELFSLLFVDRKEKKQSTGKSEWRSIDDCYSEAKYMLDYLETENYITTEKVWNYKLPLSIGLTPRGYSRVDLLRKDAAKGDIALVAMQFGDKTKPLREAIRKGVKAARYNAVFIDEVQHNDFITPELLKYIRDSKFVVVDLTHKNNGAYFEEGYAMGLGKPVIQLCKKGIKLHFDIAQKNTIMWETEDDIPERLENRIKATID